MNNIACAEITARLYSDKEPTQEQRERLLKFLGEKHSVTEMTFSPDDTIKNGFRLIVGDEIYDWTDEGRLRQLKNFISTLAAQKDTQYVPLLRDAVIKWHPDAVREEIGTVTAVGSGTETLTVSVGDISVDCIVRVS